MALPSPTRTPSRFKLLFRLKFCCSIWHKESYHVSSVSRSAHRVGSSAALHDLPAGGGGQQDSPLQRSGKDHGVRGGSGTAIPPGGCHRLPDRRQPVGHRRLQSTDRRSPAADVSGPGLLLLPPV